MITSTKAREEFEKVAERLIQQLNFQSASGLINREILTLTSLCQQKLERLREVEKHERDNHVF